jgi:hypothetical protein
MAATPNAPDTVFSNRGLTSDAARRQLAQFGPNAMPDTGVHPLAMAWTSSGRPCRGCSKPRSCSNLCSANILKQRSSPFFWGSTPRLDSSRKVAPGRRLRSPDRFDHGGGRRRNDAFAGVGSRRHACCRRRLRHYAGFCESAGFPTPQHHLARSPSVKGMARRAGGWIAEAVRRGEWRPERPRHSRAQESGTERQIIRD